jgi:hypothetical protein
MHSVSDAAEGRDYCGHDEYQLTRDADQLISEHGDQADNVAARRADASFRDGDLMGGARWLKIFRRIALAHRRRAAG